MDVPIYAHSANIFGRWHPLDDHLSAVAKLAKAYAGASTWADEAKLAGLFHDLGKYADRFQKRLEGKDSGLDHWSQGAWIALSQYLAVAESDPPGKRNMAVSLVRTGALPSSTRVVVFARYCMVHKRHGVLGGNL